MKIFIMAIFLFSFQFLFAQTNQEKIVSNQQSISSNCTFIIKPIQFPIKSYDYYYYLDSEEISPGVIISNAVAGEHQFTVRDENDEIVYRLNFTTTNGQSKSLQAVEDWPGNNRWRLTLLGGTWISGGFETMLNRYLWAAAGTGLSYYYDDTVPAHFFLIVPYAEMGYYFVGDPSTDFRFGLGGAFRYHIVLPKKKWELLVARYYSDTDDIPEGAISFTTLSAELFSLIEWKSYSFQLAIRYDFNHPAFQLVPSISWKF